MHSISKLLLIGFYAAHSVALSGQSDIETKIDSINLYAESYPAETVTSNGKVGSLNTY